jgi:hypothetical protein
MLDLVGAGKSKPDSITDIAWYQRKRVNAAIKKATRRWPFSQLKATNV